MIYVSVASVVVYPNRFPAPVMIGPPSFFRSKSRSHQGLLYQEKGNVFCDMNHLNNGEKTIKIGPLPSAVRDR